MKIKFSDKSYIEVAKSTTNHNILVTIVARDGENALVTIANTVELTKEQFDSLFLFDKQ